MSIKSDAKNGQQHQKWLFALSEILCKIGIGFISNFVLKVRVLHLTILKRINLSLPLKVETDQFVISLVLPECILSKFVAFHPRTVKRNVTALMPSLLFRYFSLFLPHLRTLAQEKRSEIVFVLGLVVGVSVSIHYGREISEYFSPLLLNFWQSDLLKICSRHQRALSNLEHAYVYWIWLRGAASHVIMFSSSRNRERSFAKGVAAEKQVGHSTRAIVFRHSS